MSWMTLYDGLPCSRSCHIPMLCMMCSMHALAVSIWHLMLDTACSGPECCLQHSRHVSSELPVAVSVGELSAEHGAKQPQSGENETCTTGAEKVLPSLYQ
jgi:hypothetical protein